MKILPLLLSLFLSQAAIAQNSNPKQDPLAIQQAVQQFLQTQATGLPGEVGITIGQIDSRLNLTACTQPEPFLPKGSRVWGKTTVGVHCAAPAPWTIYIQAQVTVIADYIVAAAPLAQGQVISANQLAKLKGDLAALPPGIITDMSQAIGKTSTMSLASGAALRSDALRSQLAIQQGQAVRLISGGPGFKVSAEGRALTNASEGQMVQARTQSGQLISGVAKTGGVVEVTY